MDYTWIYNIEPIIIANFLSNNYVEDKKFKYNYSVDFIKWYLNNNDITITVGILQNNELSGFICGKKINLMLENKNINIAEIDFLCIKKDVRNNKLCPLLINEIRKEFNKLNIYDAIFTSEHNYKNNVTHCDYYIRIINPTKLYEIGFINYLNENIYELPKIKNNKNLIKLINNDDYIKCFNLYNKYYSKFDCYEIFNEQSFINRFNNEHIITFGLIENNIIIDFISYYFINIDVINSDKKTTDGFLYYYSNNSNSLHKMILLLLHKLKENNIDSFVALDIMENDYDIMKDLKFIKKNSNYNYYFFQYNKQINNKKMAKILF